ncbi:MAG: hypothetical protein ACOC1K_01060 [Nanoarchaeota archaeon]
MKDKKNVYNIFKRFLQSKKIVEIITRKEIITTLPGSNITLDNYRNHFTLAGYLKWEKPGVYRKNNYIPNNLNSRDLRKKAYPHYKNWYEYTHLNNT